jgi:hypothetical protein
MPFDLSRHYIARYVYSGYTGRIFKKLIVFDDEIIESAIRKYFVKEKIFAYLASDGVRCDKK